MFEHSATNIFDIVLEPWYKGLEDPADTQNDTLRKLLQTYSKTQYGIDHNSLDVTTIQEYRNNFPKIRYSEIKGYLEKVKYGDHSCFLSEPPENWVMTRGSTGTPKVLPATPTHLREIFHCGARALLNYLTRNPDISLGKILNLSLPSRVASMKADDETIDYGYSSGTYSKKFPSLGSFFLVPSQEKIDRLGPSIKKVDWNNRFELVYNETEDEEIFAAIGVAPVILSFARYLKKAHGVLPRDIWNLDAIFSTSVRKIQVKYAQLFRKYFGDVSTIEIYSATEGVFAQQLDQLPYVVPNYDTYLFEVEVGNRIKMLHEMKRGEWGRLIVSTSVFPRYDICDMIESMGKNYFRVFGRAKLSHIMEHRLFRALYGAFLR